MERYNQEIYEPSEQAIIALLLDNDLFARTVIGRLNEKFPDDTNPISDTPIHQRLFAMHANRSDTIFEYGTQFGFKKDGHKCWLYTPLFTYDTATNTVSVSDRIVAHSNSVDEIMQLYDAFMPALTNLCRAHDGMLVCDRYTGELDDARMLPPGHAQAIALPPANLMPSLS
jgi:hypothetical protein